MLLVPSNAVFVISLSTHPCSNSNLRLFLTMRSQLCCKFRVVVCSFLARSPSYIKVHEILYQLDCTATFLKPRVSCSMPVSVASEFQLRIIKIVKMSWTHFTKRTADFFLSSCILFLLNTFSNDILLQNRILHRDVLSCTSFDNYDVSNLKFHVKKNIPLVKFQK